MEAAKVGKRGAIIVPGKLRKRFGVEEGSIVTAEEKDDGILTRPPVIPPIERYSAERKAEFLLSNAADSTDYRKMQAAVRKLGLDPDKVRPAATYQPDEQCACWPRIRNPTYGACLPTNVV